MILKFDHISYVTDRRKKVQTLKNFGEPLFKEVNLKNIQNKFALMEFKQENHDLYFFDGEIPTEYIFYDKVKGQSGVSVESGIIMGHYSNLEEAYNFMNELIPGKVFCDNGILKCNLRGIIDKKDYFLHLVYNPHFFKEKLSLDTEGYGEIALMYRGSNRNASCEESLIVNGKELHISFAYTKSIDIIFELIRFGK